MESFMRFFRYNCGRAEREKVLELLTEEGFLCRGFSEGEGIMTASDGQGALGSSLAHYFGYIYIQDISSTLPVMLLNPPQGSTVLDMCASPGSKTSQLARVVGSKGMVVANEPNKSRLATLRANLKRLNLINVITSGYNGQDISLEDWGFDYILLDAPCSGWGTVNKNPAAARIWTKDNVSSLKALQRELLKNAAKLLAPGGKLVYSTCTTNPAENEEQVLQAQKELSLKSLKTGFESSVPNFFPDIEIINPGMMRVKGAQMGGQDFFMALLTADRETKPVRKKNRQAHKSRPREPVAFGKDMRQPESGALWDFSGNVFFVPEQAWELFDRGFAAHGVHAGKKRGKKFILSPRMRIFLPEKPCESDFNASDPEQVKHLISGQSLDYSGSKDLVGFYWRGLALGWLKKKNNRLFWSDR
ncbi:MAG: RsmB/NOP family class I SAM-dependent RNA methyltransferase [Desulfonatronovibrio sp.]